MGRIVSNFFMAFDGVVEAPNEWHFPYFDDDMGRIMGEGMATTRAFLLGRRLYDEWSQYWPAQGPEVPFSSFINDVPKYVVTHRPLGDDPWTNTTDLGADPVDAIRRLKEDTDGDIGMSGCATTGRWLIANRLLHQLAALMHPSAVGRGQRLFEDTPTTPLALLSSEALSSGVLHLRFAPAARTG